MAGYVRRSKNWLKHLQKRNEDLRSKKIIEEGLNEGSVFKARDGKYYEEIIDPRTGEIVDYEV